MPVVKTAKEVILANHHTADIILGRCYQPNITGDPSKNKLRADALRIPRNGTLKLSPEEWEMRQNSPALKYYLDNEIITVVKREGVADITGNSIVDLEVPEHLQALQDEKGISTSSQADPQVQVSASIRRKSASTLTVPA